VIACKKRSQSRAELRTFYGGKGTFYGGIRTFYGGKGTFYGGKSFFIRCFLTMKNYETLYIVNGLCYEKIFF
jgi:hypothetical protein